MSRNRPNRLSDYTQTSMDRRLERKDVFNNATKKYTIYQRSCATAHFEKITAPQDSCPSAPDVDVGIPSGVPTQSGVETIVRSSVRWNPMTKRSHFRADTVAYSSWYKFANKTPDED